MKKSLLFLLKRIECVRKALGDKCGVAVCAN